MLKTYPEDRIYHIVYLTTNLINNKIYVGVHSTDNLNDNYLGSGCVLSKAIKKYGLNNFKKDILHFCLTRQDAFEWEGKIVDRFFVLRKDTYNRTCGGRSGNIDYNENVINKMKVPSEKRKALADSRRGKTLEEILGKEKANQAKEKNRKSHLGKKIVGEALINIQKSNINRRLNKTYIEIYGPEKAEQIIAKKIGRVVSKETCEKISKIRQEQSLQKLLEENSIQFRAKTRLLTREEVLEWYYTRKRPDSQKLVSRSEEVISKLYFLQQSLIQLTPFIEIPVSWTERFLYIVNGIKEQHRCKTCKEPIQLLQGRTYCGPSCVDYGHNRGKTAKDINRNYSKKF